MNRPRDNSACSASPTSQPSTLPADATRGLTSTRLAVGDDIPGVVLGSDFFSRPALTVARELIGKFLVRRSHDSIRRLLIHETEAYVGEHDLACHASRGHTARTAVMFGPAGIWYVYFIYGIHWMLNVVTDSPGHAAAVLIRGAGEFVGPARLTKALSIDGRQNNELAAPSTGLWIEDRGIHVPKSKIRRTPRVGVEYAGAWASKPFRFLIPVDSANSRK